MLISHRYRFIYIDIPLADGGLLKSSLMAYAEPGEEYGLPPHANTREIKRMMPECFDAYFKFTMVRNPWEYEAATYLLQRRRYEQAQLEAPFPEYLSFQEYLRDILSEQRILGRQGQFINDFTGRSMVDFAGRFESLQRDLEILGRFIGKPLFTASPPANPSIPDYPSFYNAETIEWVRHFSRPTIEKFGYTYEPEPAVSLSFPNPETLQPHYA